MHKADLAITFRQREHIIFLRLLRGFSCHWIARGLLKRAIARRNCIGVWTSADDHAGEAFSIRRKRCLPQLLSCVFLIGAEPGVGFVPEKIKLPAVPKTPPRAQKLPVSFIPRATVLVTSPSGILYREECSPPLDW